MICMITEQICLSKYTHLFVVWNKHPKTFLGRANKNYIALEESKILSITL